MELNLTHEMISINETIFDGMVEQPVELDYTLPDYYPSIFKVLKCRIMPKVYSCRTSSDKLVVDGVVLLKLMYICEDNNQVHSIEQKLPFSKTMDMRGEGRNPIISYSTKGDYINCRVVNPRRVDMRGAASMQIKVCQQQEEQVVSSVDGMGMQLNKSSMSMGSEHLWATKQFSIEEQVEVSPPAGEILSCEAVAVPSECKVISNKIVTKGDVYLHILYCPADGGGEMEVSEHTLPISQIIDMPGVDESFDCITQFDVTSVRVEPDADTEGMVHVDLDITACCDAYRNKEMQGVNDAFSTLYETSLMAKEVKTEKLICTISEHVTVKESVEVQNLSRVCDVWATVCKLEGMPMTDRIEFTGELNTTIVGFDDENCPCSVEKMVPFAFTLAANLPEDNVTVMAKAHVTCAQGMVNGSMVELRADLHVTGKVCGEARSQMLTDVTCDEARPKKKNCNCALTIYYADGGENVWDIAKRYNTSVEAIKEENNLDGNLIKGRAMILIPIVD